MSINRRNPATVYFVRRADGEGPVKIGCSQAPAERLAILMVWAPYPLEVAATIPGDETLERRFHALFAAQHSHREWFHPSPELTATIAAVAAGQFDVTTLPAQKYVSRPPGSRKMSAEARLAMTWTHRIRSLKKRGIEVPEDVRYAAFRWGAGPYFHDYRPHDPDDKALVAAWMEANWSPASGRKAA